MADDARAVSGVEMIAVSRSRPPSGQTLTLFSIEGLFRDIPLLVRL
jgi:hypothetical protein